jgi:hypothetical protein
MGGDRGQRPDRRDLYRDGRSVAPPLTDRIRTLVQPALEGAAQLQATGCSSCGHIVNVYNRPSSLKSCMATVSILRVTHTAKPQ